MNAPPVPVLPGLGEVVKPQVVEVVAVRPKGGMGLRGAAALGEVFGGGVGVVGAEPSM